ncbi:hypothetical protein MRX96_000704 [Rhipicephalus microplus]
MDISSSPRRAKRLRHSDRKHLSQRKLPRGRTGEVEGAAVSEHPAAAALCFLGTTSFAHTHGKERAGKEETTAACVAALFGLR